MPRKITVLAMAVGAVAAFVLPTSASATWRHHGVPIANDIDIPLTGKVRLQGAGSAAIECQVTSTATFFAGQTTGQVDTFDVHPADETTNCVGFGSLAPCQVHNLTPQQGNNWQFHQGPWKTVTAVQGTQTQFGVQHPTALILTPGTITYQMTGGIFCLIKHVLLHPGELGLTEEEVGGSTVGDGNTVTNLDLNGAAHSTIQTNGGATHTEEILIQGTLQVEPVNLRNTYTI